MDEIAQINQEFYDQTFARIYDDVHINAIDCNYSNKLFRKLIGAVLDYNGTYRVLDIGCGTGSYAKYFVNLFPNITLCANDISNEMLKVFRGKVNNQGNVVWLNCSAEEALRASNFDLVCFEGVLHHIDNYEDIVAATCTKILDGGWIVIFNEPSSNTTRDYFARFVDRLLMQIIVTGQFRFRSLKGKILMLFMLLLHLILPKIYRSLYPRKYETLTNLARGYGFSEAQQKMFTLSECHGEHGVNAQKIIEILRRNGFKITTYRTGPDYCFYISHTLSRVFGGSHFSLVAKKIG